jgi:hypothetical protein
VRSTAAATIRSGGRRVEGFQRSAPARAARHAHFRGLARLPIGVLLCLEFVVTGVGFVWMGKAADPTSFVLAAAVNQIGCGKQAILHDALIITKYKPV